MRLLFDPLRQQLLPAASRRGGGRRDPGAAGRTRQPLLHVRGRDHEPADAAERRRGAGPDVRGHPLVRRDPVRARPGRGTGPAAVRLGLPPDELRPGIGQPARPRPHAQGHQDRGRLREHRGHARCGRPPPSLRHPRLPRGDGRGGGADGGVRRGGAPPVGGHLRRPAHDVGRVPVRSRRALARRYGPRRLRRPYPTPRSGRRLEPVAELHGGLRDVPGGQCAGRRDGGGLRQRHERLVPCRARSTGPGDRGVHLPAGLCGGTAARDALRPAVRLAAAGPGRPAEAGTRGDPCAGSLACHRDGHRAGGGALPAGARQVRPAQLPGRGLGRDGRPDVA